MDGRNVWRDHTDATMVISMQRVWRKFVLPACKYCGGASICEHERRTCKIPAGHLASAVSNRVRKSLKKSYLPRNVD